VFERSFTFPPKLNSTSHIYMNLGKTGQGMG
jgi:hypothetical protein